MHEIIVPPIASFSSPMEEDVHTQDEEDVIGCLPRLFATAHREEIEGILANLADLAIEGNAHDLEVSYERFQKLLDLYQEQPSLLDCAIPSMLSTILSYVKLPTTERTKLDRQSAVAMMFAHHLTKVRGHKVMARQLPHDVHYLSPLISCLEAYTNTVGSDLQERSMLLLWLTIVAKNPFDLRRFDGTSSEGATLRRIFDVAMPYLRATLNRTHYSASLLLAESLARLDGHVLLPTTMESITATIRETAGGIVDSSKKTPHDVVDRLIGSLIYLLAIMKKVDRCHLLPYTHTIADTVRRFFPLTLNDALVRKCLIKTVQRLALIVLKPILAKWRYTRGKRRIEENLRAITALEDNGCESPAKIGKKRKAAAASARDADNDADEDTTVEEMELVAWIIDCLLRALEDTDTAVRWSAAKGIGRIAARLPREFAGQVVQNILQTKFHRLAGNSSWHGGCLCIAELSRRGCLLPALLPTAFRIVKKALIFQEPTGRFALGSNVRDAACYVVWAWARAYEATELAPYVEEIAASLMCVALFDREVSIRRAASAAFQENVGRQRTFPDGIALLTIADYFAVGNRKRCYTQLAHEVAAFPKYTHHLIDHLIEEKVCHWDEVVREQAAACLGLLCDRDASYIRERLTTVLLPGMETTNPIDRHGYIVASAEVYAGLRRAAVSQLEEEERTLSALPSRVREACASAGRGHEMTKRAVALAVGRMSEAALPLEDEQIGEWLSLLELLVADDKEQTVRVAADAAGPFFTRYVAQSDRWCTVAAEGFTAKMLSARREGERTAACLLSALLPPHAITTPLFEALTTIVHSRSDLDRQWATARQAAARALTTAGRNASHTRNAVRLLAIGTDDYTTDRRGDIGRVVREESMKGLAALASEGLLTPDEIEDTTLRIVHQSAEKIRNTRMTACDCIMEMVTALGDGIPSADILRQVYTHRTLFQEDSVMLALSPLLRSPVLLPTLLRALVLSVGGVSDVTTRLATQALTDYLRAASDKDQEWFVALLADMVGDRLQRISLSALKALPLILMEAACVDAAPDRCAPLQRIVATLVRIVQKSTIPSKCRLALETFSALLALPPDSSVWRTAVDSCIRALRSSFPAVRRSAAEALYEGLCVSGAVVDDDVMQMLAETTWQDTDNVPALHRCSRTIAERILGEENGVESMEIGSV